MVRDPKRLFARYGRQLLVEGAQFAGQERLHGFAAVLACDTSEVAGAAVEVCARYLVGAGLGAVVLPTQRRDGLLALDPELHLITDLRAATPPVAHFWFAQRGYGASVDVAVTDSADGYAAGTSGPARVATLRLELGATGTAESAVALGAAAADLLLADVLGLEPLPATLAIDWRQPDAPRWQRTARATDPAADGTVSVPHPPAGLRAEMHRSPAVWPVLCAEVVRGYPRETCGLVVREADGALRAIVCENLQDRYHALDPEAFPRTSRTAYKLNERAIAKAADAGAALVAIWHSHCDAGAYFSAEDARCAAPAGQPLYPDVAYLVVSAIAGEVQAAVLYRFSAATGAFAAE